MFRDLIPAIQESVKKTHPQHVDKMKEPADWGWEQWLPFWTEDETEKYVFEDNYLDFFGIDCPAIEASVDDWVKLKRWAEDNDHELVLVSAQRDHCKEPTDDWLKAWGFDFKEKHYTKHKWAVDVDVLIDDSPEKLKDFKNKSVNNGTPICMKHSYNTECHKEYICINNLSDIITIVHDIF